MDLIKAKPPQFDSDIEYVKKELEQAEADPEAEQQNGARNEHLVTLLGEKRDRLVQQLSAGLRPRLTVPGEKLSGKRSSRAKDEDQVVSEGFVDQVWQHLFKWAGVKMKTS